MAERLWYVKNCQLFERLSPEQLRRLESRARVRSFPKNSPIYLPADAADGVFVLAEGRIKLCSITPEGKQAILAFIDAGELFGELALLERGQRDEYAEAVAASTIVWLPADEIQSLMEESASLSLGVTKLIGLRRKRIERRLKSLLFRSNRERLIHLLLELIDQYGKQEADGVLISVKLSHQDLANIIGSTRETVTVLLGELQLERLLKMSRQRIVVRAPQRLVQELEGAKTVPQVRNTSGVRPSLAERPSLEPGR